jgi:hypothetical protein
MLTLVPALQGRIYTFPIVNVWEFTAISFLDFVQYATNARGSFFTTTLHNEIYPGTPLVD